MISRSVPQTPTSSIRILAWVGELREGSGWSMMRTSCLPGKTATAFIRFRIQGTRGIQNTRNTEHENPEPGTQNQERSLLYSKNVHGIDSRRAHRRDSGR